MQTRARPDPQVPQTLDFTVRRLRSVVVDLAPEAHDPPECIGAWVRAAVAQPAPDPGQPHRLVDLSAEVNLAAHRVGTPSVRPVRRFSAEWVHPLICADPHFLAPGLDGLLRWTMRFGLLRQPRLSAGPPPLAPASEWWVPAPRGACVGVALSWHGCRPPAAGDRVGAPALVDPALARVAAAIRAHGGGLRVVSTRDGGQAELWLPRSGTADPVSRHRSSPGCPTLLVASDPVVGASLARLLDHHGHDVVCFLDTGEAWAWVSSGHAPRLVLAEVRDRPGSGAALVQSMALAGLAPAVVLYAHQLRDPEGQVPRGGRIQLMQTPFSAGDVLEAVARVLPA